jgi:hypothetical protein
MKKITLALLLAVTAVCYIAAQDGDTVIISQETFGNTAHDTDGPAQAVGFATHYDWDDVDSWTSTNGQVIGGSDSSVRINNYAYEGVAPNWPDASGDMVLQMAPGASYDGSWDTMIFSNIDVSDYVVTGVSFGYMKRANQAHAVDTAGVMVEISLDGGPWTAMDTSLLADSLEGGVWEYIVLPVADFEGSTVDILIWDYYNQIIVEDVTLWGVLQPTNDFSVEYEVDVVNIADEDDYKVDADISWTDTTVVILLDIADEQVWNDGGNIYEQDNIEIYFDVDNSKGAQFDDVDDVQFRIANDSSWAAFNSIGGVTYEYEIDTLPGGDTIGYNYSITIPWDSISDGFTPAVGEQIGFDILASDNDGDPAYRDQVSWNSVSPNLWNTPYYWGVLQLGEDGGFFAIPDDEAPTVPTALAATVDGADVDLDWEASTDNRAVANYILYQDGDQIGTPATSSFGVNDLAAGTYTFTVRAVDIYGNQSELTAGEDATVEDVEPAVKENMVSFNSIYPNPTEGVVNITSEAASLVTVEVYTANGSVVMSDTFLKDYTLDLTGVAEGMYFIKLRSDDKIQVEKLIVK